VKRKERNLLVESLVKDGVLPKAVLAAYEGDVDEDGETEEVDEEVKGMLFESWRQQPAGSIRVDPVSVKQTPADNSVMAIFGGNLDQPQTAVDKKVLDREDARQKFLSEMASQVLSARPQFTHAEKVARRNQGMRLQDRGAG